MFVMSTINTRMMGRSSNCIHTLTVTRVWNTIILILIFPTCIITIAIDVLARKKMLRPSLLFVR